MAQPTPETRAARRRLRALRLALPADERRCAEQAITDALRRIRVFRRGRRVAVYLAMRGEVDLTGIIAAARRAGCELCVPRITSLRRGTMVFVPFHPDAGLRRNAYGIAEPVAVARQRLKPQSLDVVLLPVVGFDRDGNRLGMGAGYYDRALRQRRDAARRWKRPRLVGLAYSCQEVEHIRRSPWDVPLDLVVTEREIIQPARVADLPA
ncbi:MAG: 5-formyltetrahydrofolate cyclo-ligase [Gammaproteobacteria bacterium]|nr:5-formyltetrahydrofolate cyclo-ligase [Gammaproteobacteria bacterium]